MALFQLVEIQSLCCLFPRAHYKGVANRSDWINSQIFVEVLKYIQKHTLCSKENPILLLYDNHENHITLEAINYPQGEWNNLPVFFATHASSSSTTGCWGIWDF